MKGARAALLGLAALAIAPAAAAAQCSTGTTSGDVICVFESPRWAGELASLSANGILGGLTAGVAQRLKGESFADGFVRGFLGGGFSWAGKRIAAERFDGAGLIGRELAAAGASVVRNAGAGRPLLERLTLPAGPLWLEVGTGGAKGLRARVDPASAAWLIYGVVERELDLDAGASLSSGTFVFRTRGKLFDVDGEAHAAGLTSAGIIYLADVPAYGESFARRAIAHERIHVLQEDQLAILWTDPALAWAAGRAGVPASAGRLLAWNLSTELLRLLGGLVPEHRNRPWEAEAIFHAR